MAVTDARQPKQSMRSTLARATWPLAPLSSSVFVRARLFSLKGTPKAVDSCVFMLLLCSTYDELYVRALETRQEVCDALESYFDTHNIDCLVGNATHTHTYKSCAETLSKTNTRTLIHSFITLSHTHTHTHSLTHLLTLSLAHSLTHSFAHTHTHTHTDREIRLTFCTQSM